MEMTTFNAPLLSGYAPAPAAPGARALADDESSLLSDDLIDVSLQEEEEEEEQAAAERKKNKSKSRAVLLA
jgi:hypothetical protein